MSGLTLVSRTIRRGPNPWRGGGGKAANDVYTEIRELRRTWTCHETGPWIIRSARIVIDVPRGVDQHGVVLPTIRAMRAAADAGQAFVLPAGWRWRAMSGEVARWAPQTREPS